MLQFQKIFALKLQIVFFTILLSSLLYFFPLLFLWGFFQCKLIVYLNLLYAFSVWGYRSVKKKETSPITLLKLG